MSNEDKTILVSICVSNRKYFIKYKGELGITG